MRRLAKVVAVVVALGLAQPAHAGERGAVSGVGLGFFALSLASFGLGAGGLAASSDAARTLAMFDVPLPASEAAAYTLTQGRLEGGTALGIVGFVLGALSLGAGIVCLIIDTPAASATVSFTPLPQGGAFSFSARF